MNPLQSRTLRVLVVDDDTRVQSGLRQLLATTPDVELAAAAASLSEAHQALAAAEVDVALVDVRLPTSEAGLALIRELAEVLPVVALSINGAARREALAAGAGAYLEKDGDPDALVAALRRVTGSGLQVPDTRPTPDVVTRTSSNGAIGVLLLATFALPWLVWTSKIAQAHGLIGWHLPQGVALWTLTPSLLVAVLVVGGRPALRDLVARLVRWRVAVRSYLLALAVPVAIGAAAVGLTAAVGGPVRIGTTLSLGAAAGYLVYGTGLFLLAEEAAWRGLLLPRLQVRMRPLSASLLLGLVWGLWHLPLLHVPGESDEGLPLVGFLVLITGTSVLMSALVNAARGSVLLAAVFHAALDASYSFTGVVGGDPITFWATVAVTTVVAFLVVRVTTTYTSSSP